MAPKTENMLALLLRKELTIRRAAVAISLVTIAVTVAAGLLMRAVDHKEFSSLGQGVWWAVQTVTTVGYGDIVPTSVGGRVIAVVVMLVGIGFITVVTAAVTAIFVESARSRIHPSEDIATGFAKMNDRLDRIEAAIKNGGALNEP